MKKHFQSALLLIFIALQSCQTVIDIDQKDFKKRLVMTSTLNADSTISVFVTRSVGALATGLPDSITNAIVDLYEDGNLLFNIPYASFGNYTYNYHPVIGRSYKVTVSAQGFDESIEATTSIPAPPQIDTFSYALVPSTNNQQWGSTSLEGSVTINDPSGENYYMIQAVDNYIDTFSNEEYPSVLYLTTDDPLIGNSQQYSASLLFTDFSFNSSTYTIRFNAESYSGDIGSNHLTYKVYSLSKESYLYLISLQNYYNNKDNPFSEPVQVYSNVSSQMGILGAVSKWEVQIF